MVGMGGNEIDIKRTLLQIKTSDRNVQHRFRTHYNSIIPGVFKKSALLEMCRVAGIHAPARLRKAVIFERLIGGLLLMTRMRGGAGGIPIASARPGTPVIPGTIPTATPRLKTVGRRAARTADTLHNPTSSTSLSSRPRTAGIRVLGTHIALTQRPNTASSITHKSTPKIMHSPRVSSDLFTSELPILYDFESERDFIYMMKAATNPFQNHVLLNLFDILDIPGYLVYDNAFYMFTNVDISADKQTKIVNNLISFITDQTRSLDDVVSRNPLMTSLQPLVFETHEEPDIASRHDIIRVLASYITTKCILSYVATTHVHESAGLIDEASAVHFVLLELYHKRTHKGVGGVLDISNIFSTIHFNNAFSCFTLMKQHLETRDKDNCPNIWWANHHHCQGEMGKQYGGGDSSMPPSNMHPANFIIQRNFEKICGFVAIFTMISKSGNLNKFFTNTIEQHHTKIEADIASYQKNIEKIVKISDTTNESIATEINETLEAYGAHKLRLDRNNADISALQMHYNTANSTVVRFSALVKIELLQRVEKSIAESIHAINKHVTTLTIKFKENVINRDNLVNAIQHMQGLATKSLEKTRKLKAHMEVLFAMENNLNILIDSAASVSTANFLSINFKSHRLLDQLQNLFPESLQWSNQVNLHYLYNYTLNLFEAAGVPPTDISIVTSKKGANLKYECKYGINAKETNGTRQHLYVHMLCDAETSTNLCIPLNDNTPQMTTHPFKTDIKGYTFDLGGFVFTSLLNRGSFVNHAISGFKSNELQYIYNGYYDPDNLTLPCAPIESPTWKELFSGTDYILSMTGECGLTEASTANATSSMHFKYPFHGYFGFGIMTKQPYSTDPISSPVTQNTSIDVATLKTHYVENYNAKLINVVKTTIQSFDNDSTLDQIYKILQPTQTPIYKNNAILYTSDAYAEPLYGCIDCIIMNIRNWVCEKAAFGDLYNHIPFEHMKAQATMWFGNDLYSPMFINIIIHVAATVYDDMLFKMHSTSNIKLDPSTPQFTKFISHGIDGTKNSVFNIIKYMYVPLSIVRVVKASMLSREADPTRLEKWLLSKCVELCIHHTTTTPIATDDNIQLHVTRIIEKITNMIVDTRS
jgi:hypothetical protein